MQQLLYFCGNDFNLGGRLETGHDVALLVDEELGEVPFDVGLLLVVGVVL